MPSSSGVLRGVCLCLGFIFAGAPAIAQDRASVDVAIEQSRGADPRVDYASLTRYGPWDDRNYELTVEDLELLPKHDQYLHRVPAFFKVIKRKEFIEEGTPLADYYPREIHFEFYYRYGGLMQNGEINLTSLGKYYYPDPANPQFPAGTRNATIPMAAPVEGEGPLAIGTDETSVEVHPVNPQLLIAGANGSGGQNQNYSIDGGQTWVTGGLLPQTCCDPAMEWSVDGSVAYSATLGVVGGNLRATVFRSINNGMTWQGRVDVSSGSSDKEYIHVDRSLISPFSDNVYLTWHQGNTMFFSRSQDQAQTWSIPVSFPLPAYPRGIGSDITTDPNGNIYYFYPSLEGLNSRVVLLKSEDAGVTWSAPITVADLHGEFDFPVPSMESRRVFIYVAADVDVNTGRIYASWTDKTPASPAGNGGGVNANVAWIRVAYSDNQGATWTMAATPHDAPLPPSNTAIDRYHQWIDVDPTGVVHLGFYDTRHTTNRTGVDFYYVASADGGLSWQEETRVSAASSVNIANGQEWGDYNGLAFNAGNNNIVMTWTDNRLVNNTPQQRSFAGRVGNVLGQPTFLLSVDGQSSFTLCAGDPIPATDLSVTSIDGFVTPVNLSLPGLDPSVFTGGSFSPNPVVPAQPPALSTLSGLSTLGNAASGNYLVDIQGMADAEMRVVALNVDLYGDTPAATVLAAPTDGATGIATTPMFSWQATVDAEAYEIEIATDEAFTNIIDSNIVEGTSYTTGVSLLLETTYYWRVRAVNPCGDGAWWLVFDFTTGNDLCRTPNLAIPDNSPGGANDDFVIAETGTLESLQLHVRLDHTYIGDVAVRLSKVNGAGPIAAIDRPGVPATTFGCPNDNINVTLDDDAALPVENQCNGTPPAILGTFSPNQPLATFAGEELSGTWRLNVSDAFTGDIGTLLEWCLVPVLGDGESDVIFEDDFECAPGKPGCEMGGVTLSEGFEDITTLPAAGWLLQNNSQPLGSTSWF